MQALKNIVTPGHKDEEIVSNTGQTNQIVPNSVTSTENSTTRSNLANNPEAQPHVSSSTGRTPAVDESIGPDTTLPAEDAKLHHATHDAATRNAALADEAGSGLTSIDGEDSVNRKDYAVGADKKEHGIIRQILNPHGEKYDPLASGDPKQAAINAATLATVALDQPLYTVPEHKKSHGIIRQLLNPNNDKYDSTRFGETAVVQKPVEPGSEFHPAVAKDPSLVPTSANTTTTGGSHEPTVEQRHNDHLHPHPHQEHHLEEEASTAGYRVAGPSTIEAAARH